MFTLCTTNGVVSCYMFLFNHLCIRIADETGEVFVTDLRSPCAALLTYKEHARTIHKMKFSSLK